MPITTWAAGTDYAPGTLTRKKTVAAPFSTAITDPDLELGGASWTLDAGITVSTEQKFSGTQALKAVSGLLNAYAAAVPCAPGTQIKASCMLAHGAAAGALAQSSRVQLRWRDSGGTFIPGVALGNAVQSVGAVRWAKSEVTAIAPAGAASVVIGAILSSSTAGAAYADKFTWDYDKPATHYEMIFRATQAATAKSAATEPVWPTVVGGTVVDGGVTWTAEVANRVIWQAKSILRTGPVPPNAPGGPGWPTSVGASVENGTIRLRTISRRVEDPRCPNSKIVRIAASKIYAGDNDIIAYSATNQPLDWTSVEDAGFWAFGLHEYGSNPVAAMDVYRGNLVAFNVEAFQMLNVDADPANMSKLDELPIGTSFAKATSPVSNDLFFLSSEGVRTIGIAAGSTNLQAGDVGMPVDPLITALVAEAEAAGEEPLSIYYPNAGQYWVCFPRARSTGPGFETEVFVYTMTRTGGVGAWSRYIYPFRFDGLAQRGDTMVVRSGDDIMEISEDLLYDFAGSVDQVGFEGVLQWPWLDFGAPGVDKQVEGFDIVGAGTSSIQFGYDQTNLAAFTTPYAIPADTLPGMMIGMPVTAPTLSVRLTYAAGQKWQFDALNVYLVR